MKLAAGNSIEVLMLSILDPSYCLEFYAKPRSTHHTVHIIQSVLSLLQFIELYELWSKEDSENKIIRCFGSENGPGVLQLGDSRSWESPKAANIVKNLFT